MIQSLGVRLKVIWRTGERGGGLVQQEEERVKHLNEVMWERVFFFTVGGGGYALSDQKQLGGRGSANN